VAQPPLQTGCLRGFMNTCHHFIIVQNNRQRKALGQNHADTSTARHSHRDSLIPRTMQCDKVCNTTDNMWRWAHWGRCHQMLKRATAVLTQVTQKKTSAQPKQCYGRQLPMQKGSNRLQPACDRRRTTAARAAARAAWAACVLCVAPLNTR